MLPWSETRDSQVTTFLQHDRCTGNDVRLTPPDVLNALGGWGSFDLDPCAAPEPRPWSTAQRHITLPDDGLAVPWEGHVWCNPPYSTAAPWAARLSAHGLGVLLVFARTGSGWYQDHVLRSPTVSGVLFLRGRLQFRDAQGRLVKTKRGVISNAGAPSCLVAYDRPGEPQWSLTRLALCGLEGVLVQR